MLMMPLARYRIITHDPKPPSAVLADAGVEWIPADGSVVLRGFRGTEVGVGLLFAVARRCWSFVYNWSSEFSTMVWKLELMRRVILCAGNPLASSGL